MAKTVGGRLFNVADDENSEHEVVSNAPLFRTANKNPLQPGLVSQRLTEFAKLFEAMPMRSIGAVECMPDTGFVTQRIQQHQRFINQV